MKLFIAILSLVALVVGQWNPHFSTGRSVMVHLFEWKWEDIALECERFLGPKGFGGVQISPPQEALVKPNRPWWERYQPASYKLDSRSGTEQEFADMIRRCKAVGVNIYPDVVFNHMGDKDGLGTGGLDYPDVPFDATHFNDRCEISYQDPVKIRDCWLLTLPDLNQKDGHVQERIIDFLNRMIELGVAGFRIDAAKHMWPEDLEAIFGGLNNLNTEIGHPEGARPFIFQEVIDLGGEPVKSTDYTHIGAITEFRHSAEIGRVFHGRDQLQWLVNWGVGWGMLPTNESLIFVDNHDNQRGHGAGGNNILSFKTPKRYTQATAYELAHPYGIVRLMSSYDFTDGDQGPPADVEGNLISPTINADGTCDGGWICEHRWPVIARMVQFRNSVGDAELDNWWDNKGNAIAFSREDRGFFAVSQEQSEVAEFFQTGMAEGVYCDLITGEKVNGACTGKEVAVREDGFALISLAGIEDPAISATAITIDTKL